jgi:hypothetical protein
VRGKADGFLTGEVERGEAFASRASWVRTKTGIGFLDEGKRGRFRDGRRVDRATQRKGGRGAAAGSIARARAASGESSRTGTLHVSSNASRNAPSCFIDLGKSARRIGKRRTKPSDIPASHVGTTPSFQMRSIGVAPAAAALGVAMLASDEGSAERREVWR